MAKPQCTICSANEGALIITNLDNGETVTVCVADIPVYYLAGAAQYTEGMTVETAEAIAPLLDQLRANDPRPAKPNTSRRKKTDAVTPADAPATPVTAEYGPESIPLVDECPSCGNMTAFDDSVNLVCSACGTVIASEAASGT